MQTPSQVSSFLLLSVFVVSKRKLSCFHWERKVPCVPKIAMLYFYLLRRSNYFLFNLILISFVLFSRNTGYLGKKIVKGFFHFKISIIFITWSGSLGESSKEDDWIWPVEVSQSSNFFTLSFIIFVSSIEFEFELIKCSSFGTGNTL